MPAFALQKITGVSFQAQIYRYWVTQFSQNKIGPGEFLPSVRTSAQDFNVSLNTIRLAYEKLVEDGYVINRPGIGYIAVYSKDVNTGVIFSPPQKTQAFTPPLFARSTGFHQDPCDKSAFSFRLGAIDPLAFPWASWKRWNNASSHYQRELASAYQDPAGLYPLREQICQHVLLNRGIKAVPEQIVVTHGTQESLSLLTRLFLGPDSSAVIENPGYAGAWQLFHLSQQISGNRIIPVDIDNEGMRTEVLPAGKHTLCYVTPGHQFPTGVTLSQTRRYALLAWACQSGCYVVEDDYDSEFQYGTTRVPALKSLDNQECVIYLSSFSKSLGAGLRVGYMICPQHLTETITSLKALLDKGNSGLSQAFLTDFMLRGDYLRHLKAMEKRYAKRYALLRSALADIFPHSSLYPATAGLHLALHYNEPQPLAERLTELNALGIGFGRENSYFSPSEDRQTSGVLSFGFGGINSEHLKQALALMH
ncbi:PLP-dependent aminotransferase family protein [Edaphovirga cremea]|uniref:MocR-like pyridoxine biosynthesis transcription factor PdxR n=1 Tax=Edaphovirga cremea TaxID=2267246 RepID=UPI0013007959|nr:PLP-dependent aminotransferase family protein [Edaphovirga cremea]